jgi:hypothetical protein
MASREGAGARPSTEKAPYWCIVRGPLRGAEGILLRRKNELRVVLSIDVIACSASMEVDSADIERVP